MTPIIEAWFVLVVSVAGWLNREQDKAVQYLLAENKVLKEQLKSRGGRILFTDKQRSLLAAKAKELSESDAEENRHHRDPGHAASLAPKTHRQEVRRQRATAPGATQGHA